MKTWRLSLLLSVLMPITAWSAPGEVAQREINGLMQALSGSQCQFNRNGKWYAGTKAREHLQGKYDYLRKRDLVDSAEQFIERAASRSSISGTAYRVRCPGQAEQDASRWFAAVLEQLRRSSKPAP